MTTTYKARKEAGLCVMCGGVKNSERVYCPKCMEYMKQYEKERRERLMAAGRCIKCGRKKENPNLQKCWACGQKASIYEWEHRKRRFSDEYLKGARE